VGRRAAPLVALSRRMVAMMVAAVLMMTIILSKEIISMMHQGMDADGTIPLLPVMIDEAR